LSAENSFAHPKNVAPESTSISMSSGSIPLDLRPYSVTVFRVPIH
jgi:alpha-L-arabinofuranosidase